MGRRVVIPDLDQITDLASARALLEQLVGLLEDVRGALEDMRAENAELRRLLFGRVSERMPPIEREIHKSRAQDPAEAAKRKAAAQAKRRKNGEAKKRLPVQEIVHEVPEDEQVCPNCGDPVFDDLGEGEVSWEYEYVPPRLVQRKHVRKKKTCRCRQCVITAPGPARVSEGVQYGPGLHAHVVVSKCADSMPLYRQEKQMRRVGLPLKRSTLGDMWSRSADLLEPLARRILDKIVQAPHVNADETPMPVMAPIKTKTGFVWTFVAGKNVAYEFSASRSGKTPQKILGGTNGKLTVDGYSGYNKVCTPETRTRTGCWAHARRYFFKALATAQDEARHAMDQILDLYKVEYEVAEKNMLGTAGHLALRRTRSRKITVGFRDWLDEQKPLHRPKSPIGKAITYVLKNWDALTVFLSDPKVRLDNNLAEGHLRVVAMGRKAFLFVGNEAAGKKLAVLQTLVSTCNSHGVNPQAYLTEVLIRIQIHPQSRIDELLPDKWKPPDEPAGAPPGN
jgi:transposase